MIKRWMMFISGMAFAVAALITCVGSKNGGSSAQAATPAVWEYASLKIDSNVAFSVVSVYFNQPSGEEFVTMDNRVAGTGNTPFRGCALNVNSQDAVGRFTTCVFTALGNDQWELADHLDSAFAGTWTGFIFKRPKQ